MKLLDAPQQVRAECLQLWDSGRLGHGLPFWKLLEDAEYDQEQSTVVHKELTVKLPVDAVADCG